TFNNIQLLKGTSVVGSASLQIQVGWTGAATISLNFMTMTSTSLGVNSLNLSDSTGAAGSTAIETINDAIYLVSQLQSKIGAYQNRLQYAGDFISLQEVYTTSALAAIEDTDFASELSKFTQGNLLVQSATGTLAQSNMVMEKVLSLLGVGR
nr:flagellin [Candidatus Dependentiae bacterium]